MRQVFLLILMLSGGVTVFGQYGEGKANLPADELELRTRLESDNSIIQVTCGLLMPIGPKEMYADIGRKQQAENTRIRLQFFKAATANKTMRVGTVCGTDEGGTIKQYLLSENGNLTFVDDYSRDAFGGLRITSYPCIDLRLGHYVTNKDKEIVFEEFLESEAAGKVVFLRCTAVERQVIF